MCWIWCCISCKASATAASINSFSRATDFGDWGVPLELAVEREENADVNDRSEDGEFGQWGCMAALCILLQAIVRGGRSLAESCWRFRRDLQNAAMLTWLRLEEQLEVYHQRRATARFIVPLLSGPQLWEAKNLCWVELFGGHPTYQHTNVLWHIALLIKATHKQSNIQLFAITDHAYTAIRFTKASSTRYILLALEWRRQRNPYPGTKKCSWNSLPTDTSEGISNSKASRTSPNSMILFQYSLVRILARVVIRRCISHDSIHRIQLTSADIMQYRTSTPLHLPSKI